MGAGGQPRPARTGPGTLTGDEAQSECVDVFNLVETECGVGVLFNEIDHRLNHPAGLGGVGRHNRKPQDGALPIVVAINFGNRDIEPLTHMGHKWTDH